MEEFRIISVLKNGGIFQMGMEFLSPHEKHACQLMELMEHRNKDVYAVVGLSGESLSISGIFYCSKGGTVLPFFEKTDANAERLLLDFFSDRKIFCISGEKNSVDFLARILESLGKQHIKESREFMLMEAEGLDLDVDMGGLDFRLCDKTDSDELFPLQVAYLKEEVLPDGMSLNLPSERLAMDRMLKGGKIYAIRDRSGKILCKAQINSESRAHILIGGVYTEPGSRRKGLAKLMMKTLLKISSECGKSCVLFVNKLNAAAISLYEKTGFRKIGEHEIVYMS